jgi:hypothetical protein
LSSAITTVLRACSPCVSWASIWVSSAIFWLSAASSACWASRGSPDRIDELREIVERELDRQHPGLDGLDIGDQRPCPVPQVLVAEKGQRALSLAGNAQPLVEREQAGPQGVGEDGQRQGCAHPVARRIAGHTGLRRINIDRSIAGSTEDGGGHRRGERHEVGLDGQRIEIAGLGHHRRPLAQAALEPEVGIDALAHAGDVEDGQVPQRLTAAAPLREVVLLDVGGHFPR